MSDKSESCPSIHNSLRRVTEQLVTDPRTAGDSVMRRGFTRFHPDEKVRDPAQVFERYDLVSAPVTGGDGRLIGRVTANAVMDCIRHETDSGGFVIFLGLVTVFLA